MSLEWYNKDEKKEVKPRKWKIAAGVDRWGDPVLQAVDAETGAQIGGILQISNGAVVRYRGFLDLLKEGGYDTSPIIFAEDGEIQDGTEEYYDKFQRSPRVM